MLGHVLSRHGAGDINDVRRGAAGARRVRRCADRSHDLGGIEGRRRLDGHGREPADAHYTGLYRKLSGTGAPLYKFFLDYGFAHAPDAKISFGMAGDVPLVGNFTSDGFTSLVIYRNGIWYLDTNRDGAVDKTVGLGGLPGDIPLAANFTGSGSMDDLVIYRSGTWYVDQSFNGSVNKTFRFGGVPGDIPLAGDVNGDGIADLVIYRNGTWYIDTLRDGAVHMTVNFGGMPQDIPLLFDYDGDGKMDLCIFRDGIWYVNTKRDGTLQAMFSFGAAGDIPLTGHFY